MITPYLKGIHLTLDGWRPWRKDDGWRMSNKEVRAALMEREHNEMSGLGCGPSRVKPPKDVMSAPRLYDDVYALKLLFKEKEPVKRRVRLSQRAVAFYGFADASGQGFGSMLLLGSSVRYRHGQWTVTLSEESSNFRELFNLVNAIEDAYQEGALAESELFMFTDNSTAESAYYKGNSSSEALFDLVLRLRLLQMKGDLMIHVIHISGLRMMAQGTDGLSRGNMGEGVMQNGDLLSYVPLHLSALERSRSVADWVYSWAGLSKDNWLSPTDWFSRGQDMNGGIWCPPPAAAEAMMECLGKCVHKRPDHLHIVIIPRLMTARWRKQLGKICDTVFTVPLGTTFWDSSQFEPLLIGIYIPLLPHRPWRFRRTKYLERMERLLSELPATDLDWGRNLLRQLLVDARQLGTMPSGLVWDMLQGQE